LCKILRIITSFLLIIGYKFNEIENFLIKFDFSKIFDLQFEKIFTEDNFKGLSNGENFNKLIKKFLIKKELDENITLNELYKKTNKDLIIGVTNITEDKVEYLNHVNYPDLPVYLALRMSCCLPIIFNPIIYKNNYYLDGGLKDNFPIQLILDEELKYTIGIVIYPFTDIYDINDMITIKYIYHLFRTISSSNLKCKINKYKDICRLFIVTITNENLINYKIDENNRIELFNLGYEQCKIELTNILN
jgi:NTE family protein